MTTLELRTEKRRIHEDCGCSCGCDVAPVEGIVGLICDCGCGCTDSRREQDARAGATAPVALAPESSHPSRARPELS